MLADSYVITVCRPVKMRHPNITFNHDSQTFKLAPKAEFLPFVTYPACMFVRLTLLCLACVYDFICECIIIRVSSSCALYVAFGDLALATRNNLNFMFLRCRSNHHISCLSSSIFFTRRSSFLDYASFADAHYLLVAVKAVAFIRESACSLVGPGLPRRVVRPDAGDREMKRGCDERSCYSVTAGQHHLPGHCSHQHT